jgi:hypothetical protein
MKAELRAAERTATLVHPCPVCGAGLDRGHLEESRDGFHCVFCGALQNGPPNGAEPSPAPAGLGKALREARERRGESLEVASRETRIHERFLQSLEDDAPCGAYPGAVYGRFFLREYAEYLGLDPEPLVSAFDRARTEPAVVPLRDRALPKQPTGGSRVAVALAAVALAVVAVLSWTGGSRERGLFGAPATSLPPAHAAAQSPAAHADAQSQPPSPARLPPQENPPPQQGVHAVLRMESACWIRAVVDGNQVLARTYPAGSMRSFHAHHTLELTLGNAGAVRLRVDGDLVPTGAAGQVVHLSFEWRRGKLVSSP